MEWLFFCDLLEVGTCKRLNFKERLRRQCWSLNERCLTKLRCRSTGKRAQRQKDICIHDIYVRFAAPRYSSKATVTLRSRRRSLSHQVNLGHLSRCMECNWYSQGNKAICCRSLLLLFMRHARAYAHVQARDAKMEEAVRNIAKPMLIRNKQIEIP